MSRMLQLRNIKHNVLNAKQHQREAEIVAEAGKKAMSPWLPIWQGVVQTSRYLTK